MESESESQISSVGKWIREEVWDWEDEVKGRARFKGFSGQRKDWEGIYLFWRDLIINLSLHFRLLFISPSLLNSFFSTAGLTPLCLHHVLLEMYKAGDLLRSSDVVDPTTGRLSQFLRQAINVMRITRSLTPEDISEDQLIVSTLLKDRAVEVVKLLSERHWTSSCVVTMKNFQAICGGASEASALLSYLSGCGKAKYLSVRKKDTIEGVKVSLSSEGISNITTLDSDLLHLVWTTEKLEQQLYVIDQRYERSRRSALACLKSGNKKVALRHARELKLGCESREKCTSLLNRVEEVITIIADAESTKKVSEAIQIGGRAIKDHKISVEEIEQCLEEVDEIAESQKQVNESLVYMGIDDVEIEEELKELELQVGRSKTPEIHKTNRIDDLESLSNSLSDMKLTDDGSNKLLQNNKAQPEAA